MQYHYVVVYDSEEKKWNVEYDSLAYFEDGNVWSLELSEKNYNNGWFCPSSKDDNPKEFALDAELFETLQYIIAAMPIPKEG